jgi:hypothetical protein
LGPTTILDNTPSKPFNMIGFTLCWLDKAEKL